MSTSGLTISPGRYGGDEFIIMIAGTTSLRAAQVAARLTAAPTRVTASDGTPVPFTVSIGVAESVGCRDLQSLLARRRPGHVRRKASRRRLLARLRGPRGYQKLKTIYDPAGDWDDRLWYDFTLDIRAAHQIVDPDAHLVRVIVAGYDAAWVYPGVCDNSIGYWHVSGARVVYRQDGQERSIGIASLISWRGVWYVVHFGAVLRGVVTGIVDDPEPGPGIPGPAGGC